MSLFGKKQPELPANFLDDEPAEAAGVDHKSVLDYLLQLKTEDYDKLLKLAGIYRKANKEAGALIPQYDPDKAPEAPAAPEAEDDALLLDDDDLSTAFLEDEPKKGKKVKVNDVSGPQS